jgi:hypothetical protein
LCVVAAGNTEHSVGFRPTARWPLVPLLHEKRKVAAVGKRQPTCGYLKFQVREDAQPAVLEFSCATLVVKYVKASELHL